MALKIQASFSAGELDPALHERTTLKKFDTGLATARNTYIGKTGRVISRGARKHIANCKLSSRRVKIHQLGYLGAYIEWGHQYARLYISDGEGGYVYDDEVAHAYTEDQLDDIQLVNGYQYAVYVFLSGTGTKVLICIPLTSFAFLSDAEAFYLPAVPTHVFSTITGTGYGCQYIATVVLRGQESLASGAATGTIPINAGEYNEFVIKVGAASNASVITEMRVYRRPTNAGAYGYIGSSSYFATSGADLRATFRDLGQEADYTHAPPAPNSVLEAGGYTSPVSLTSPTGVIFDSRLLVATTNGGIVTSRPKYLWDFYRDFPINDSSSLAFRSGTEAASDIFFMIETEESLVVFTANGVYAHVGALSTTNLSLKRRGKWVIDKRVPPIVVPGGLLFIDSCSNTIRRLLFSQEAQGFVAEEMSIYSDHLFLNKRVVSWAFEPGDVSLLYVVFNDGTYASFNFEPDQEMRAWTRNDSVSDILIENVANSNDVFLTNVQDALFSPTVWVVNKDGTRSMEYSVPRYVSADVLEDDPEAYMGHSIAYMDSMVSWKDLLNDSLPATRTLNIAAVTPGVWDGPLDITQSGGTGILTIASGYGQVGAILKYFDTEDGTSINLTVISRVSDSNIRVQPSAEFPSDQVTAVRLYRTVTTFTGLNHMEGEEVSVIADGYVIASPNNDIDDYPTLTVSSGSITLPNSYDAAIVHIGRPITGDVETLDIDTVEQHPTLIESKTVNKLYIKTHRSSGLFVGSEFPADNKVAGMESLDRIDIDYEEETEILGNRFQAPTTKRTELTLPGDWRSNGRVCIRQVDPLHFEILSIIPDMEELRR